MSSTTSCGPGSRRSKLKGPSEAPACGAAKAFVASIGPPLRDSFTSVLDGRGAVLSARPEKREPRSQERYILLAHPGEGRDVGPTVRDGRRDRSRALRDGHERLEFS